MGVYLPYEWVQDFGTINSSLLSQAEILEGISIVGNLEEVPPPKLNLQPLTEVLELE